MTTSANTHCPYCALQCAMTLTSPAGLTPASEPGSVPVPALAAEKAAGTGPVLAAPLTVEGRDFPTNRGGLCRKGWTSATLLNHPGRVTEPLLKGDDGDPPPHRLGPGPGPGDHSGEGNPRPLRQGRRRRLWRWRPHQRKGVHAGQVRPAGPGHLPHRLQRPVLHVLRGRRRDARLRRRPRASLPRSRRWTRPAPS